LKNKSEKNKKKNALVSSRFEKSQVQREPGVLNREGKDLPLAVHFFLLLWGRWPPYPGC
jgi:hypothetical protein